MLLAHKKSRLEAKTMTLFNIVVIYWIRIYFLNYLGQLTATMHAEVSSSIPAQSIPATPPTHSRDLDLMPSPQDLLQAE